MVDLKNGIAVLLIAYNRPENTLKQIRKLIETDSRIYLFIDGPRDEEIRVRQESLVAEALKITDKDSSRILINQERINLRLANAIPKAIDWVFSQESAAVILEDDIEFHQEFLPFAQRILLHFQADDEVLLVTGNQFMEPCNGDNISFTSYPLIWGWGTTHSKWLIMKKLANEELLKKTVALKPQVAAYWTLGWKRSKNNQLNSWIIQIAAQMRFMGKLCVAPSVNLTSNIGDDQVAAHTTKKSPGLHVPIYRFEWNSKCAKITSVGSEVYDAYLEKNLYRVKIRNIVSLMFHNLTQIFTKV
jgi:hypothetical protein